MFQILPCGRICDPPAPKQQRPFVSLSFINKERTPCGGRVEDTPYRDLSALQYYLHFAFWTMQEIPKTDQRFTSTSTPSFKTTMGPASSFYEKRKEKGKEDTLPALIWFKIYYPRYVPYLFTWTVQEICPTTTYVKPKPLQSHPCITRRLYHPEPPAMALSLKPTPAPASTFGGEGPNALITPKKSSAAMFSTVNCGPSLVNVTGKFKQTPPNQTNL